jgi:type II secretory pathway component GspD/PulD (secretin)
MKPARLFTFQLVCIAVVLLCLVNTVQAEDVAKATKPQTQQSQRALSVQFDNDLLTVKAEDVPLQEVLQEIARQSDLSVEGSRLLEDKITIQFDRLALDEGLRLILRRYSFALVYVQKAPEGTQPVVLQLESLRIAVKEGEESLVKRSVVDSNRHKGALKQLPEYPPSTGGTL